MKTQQSVRSSMSSLVIAGGAVLAILSGGAAKADDAAPKNRSIAYAFTTIYWSMYETKDGKEECPQGLNVMGPREQFKALFPEGTKHTFVDTQMKREAEIWWPDVNNPDPYPVPEAVGKIVPGLNLDGKVKPTDFTSPDGTPGVDNQMFRAVGCIKNYRTGGPLFGYETSYFKMFPPGRVLIELTDVDSLVNDDDVTLTTYRGLDPLVSDASGTAFQPGGTERLDLRYGKAFIHTTKGKIVNGVLTTQPMDWTWPTEMNTADLMKAARFQVKLTPDSGEGLIGGYADIESIYNSRNRKWTTHFQAYGQQAQASTYNALRKFADGYPDPKTGVFTAISGAYTVKFVQVRVLHPEKQISELRDSAPKQFADSGSKAAAK